MLIKDNTEHRTVLSSMCISVCNILSHVSILALLYHFFHILLYGSYFYTNAFFACLHVTVYSVSLFSGDLKGRKIT